MKKLINMTDCQWDTERFKDAKDAEAFFRDLGFDGMELMHCQGGDPGFFFPHTIKGLHLRCQYDWVDLWNGNMDALEMEYGTLDQAAKVYGGLDRDCILKPLKEDLELACRLQASYVVFHVCDVKTTEFFTHHFFHTDEEVIDASAELINELLDGQPYEFEFLMENLWWPGLSMTNPKITRRLLSKVHYPKKGIMLDTGHLMHNRLDLSTQEDAIDYILEQIDAHGALAEYIRGVHLNQSLTGSYVQKLSAQKDAMPASYPERMDACYRHLFHIDQHLPFTTPKVSLLLDRLQPSYVTFELITCDRSEHEKKLRQQMEAITGSHL